MSKAKCKCQEEECECPEWIFTFADLVMLMMGFFVILWVLKPAPGKTQDEQSAKVMTDNWLETVGEVRGAFGWEPDPKSTDPVDQIILKKRRRMNTPGMGGKIDRTKEAVDGKDEEVTSIRPGKQAVVGSRILFAPADSALSREALLMLDQIAVKVRGHRNITLVKGHTSLDDFSDTASAQQKMDLSLRRAQTVADYLIAHGVEPEIIRVQGCSTFEPVIQRTYTPNAQATNRRVEVEDTTTLVEEMQDQTHTNLPTAPLRPAGSSSPANKTSH